MASNFATFSLVARSVQVRSPSMWKRTNPSPLPSLVAMVRNAVVRSAWSLGFRLFAARASLAGMSTSAAERLPDVLELAAEDDGITSEQERRVHEAIARYSTPDGLDFERMRADMAAGRHPYQRQPQR
jgi:hypothetical protein